MKISKKDPSKILVSFRAEKEQYKRLKTLSKDKGLKLSTIFRNAISQAIEELENECKK